MSEHTYTVIFAPDLEDGDYVATVPTLGIATQGESLEEARRMVKEAIVGYLEGLQQEGQPIPEEPEAHVPRILIERVEVKV